MTTELELSDQKLTRVERYAQNQLLQAVKKNDLAEVRHVLHLAESGELTLDIDSLELAHQAAEKNSRIQGMLYRYEEDVAMVSDSDSEDEEEYNYVAPVAPINEKFQSKSVGKILFHFRGINFYPEHFNRAGRSQAQRVVYLQQRSEIKPTGIHSAASYDVASVAQNIPFKKSKDELDEYFAKNEAKLQDATNDVMLNFRKLKVTGKVAAVLTQTSSRSTYESRADEFFQRYMNSYTPMKKDIVKDRSANLTDKRLSIRTIEKCKVYKSLLSASFPIVSTSEEPRWGLEYAYGMVNWDKTQTYQPRAGKTAPLTPSYNSDGHPSYPYLGIMYITCHKPLALEDSARAISLFSQNRVDLRCSAPGGHTSSGYIRYRERMFIGGINKDNVCMSVVVRVPNFFYEYRDYYADKYGMDKNQYDAFKTKLLKYGTTQKGEKRNVKAFHRTEYQIVQHVIQHMQTVLLGVAKDFANNHNSKMRFVGLTEGKLLKTPPTIESCVEQNTKVKLKS